MRAMISKTRKTVIIIISLFLIIAAANSCKYIQQEEKALNLICLVDFSGSLPESTVDWYGETIKGHVIRNLGYNDKITVLPIDYASQTGSLEILHKNFGTIEFSRDLDSPTMKAKLRQRRFKSYVDSLIPDFQEEFEEARSLREDYSRGTDILGALKQSGKYINKEDNNLILIFSDMVHESDAHNFNRELNSEKSRKRIIQRVEDVVLPNTKVFVLTGMLPDMKIEKYELLKKFWNEYFNINNMDLIQYSSGGRSILVEEIKSYKE